FEFCPQLFLILVSVNDQDPIIVSQDIVHYGAYFIAVDKEPERLAAVAIVAELVSVVKDKTSIANVHAHAAQVFSNRYLGGVLVDGSAVASFEVDELVTCTADLVLPLAKVD